MFWFRTKLLVHSVQRRFQSYADELDALFISHSYLRRPNRSQSCETYNSHRTVQWLRPTAVYYMEPMYVTVAYWRSLASELTLSCARPAADGWPQCGKTVRCRSTNQANSAFHPSGVDKWVVGQFIGCVLKWLHLVNTYEVTAGLRLTWLLFAVCGSICPC